MSLLDTINQMLKDMLGPFGPLIVVGFLGLVMVLVTIPLLFKKEVDPLDKLNALVQEKAAPEKSKKDKLRQASGKDKLEKYSNFLEPQNAEEYSAIKLKLLQAGYKSKNAVRMYHFAQLALGISLLIVGIGYSILQSQTGDPSTKATILSIIGPAVAGYMLPKYWVTRRQGERQQAIVNGFPDSLDMMLVCVEAGQSLDQSIIRVAREMRSGFPALAEEYEMVSYEMKAGKEGCQIFCWNGSARFN